MNKELKKYLEVLNALDGHSRVSLNRSCGCGEPGKDGTVKHSSKKKEHVIRVLIAGGHYYITACGNHLQNYQNDDVYKEIKSIEDIDG